MTSAAEDTKKQHEKPLDPEKQKQQEQDNKRERNEAQRIKGISDVIFTGVMQNLDGGNIEKIKNQIVEDVRNVQKTTISNEDWPKIKDELGKRFNTSERNLNEVLKKIGLAFNIIDEGNLINRNVTYTAEMMPAGGYQASIEKKSQQEIQFENILDGFINVDIIDKFGLVEIDAGFPEQRFKIRNKKLEIETYTPDSGTLSTDSTETLKLIKDRAIVIIQNLKNLKNSTEKQQKFKGPFVEEKIKEIEELISSGEKELKRLEKYI